MDIFDPHGLKHLKYNLSLSVTQAFAPVRKVDSGQYYCESVNKAGPPKSCKAMNMEVRKYSLLSEFQKQTLT